MDICVICEAMAAEPDATLRAGSGMLVKVCVEREPIGKRYTRMRCLECEKEWLKIELTTAPWTVSWVEG